MIVTSWGYRGTAESKRKKQALSYNPGVSYRKRTQDARPLCPSGPQNPSLPVALTHVLTLVRTPPYPASSPLPTLPASHP